MPRAKGLGELERRLLLNVLELGNSTYAVSLSQALEQATGKRISRGALYTTLDRLEDKGLMTWRTEATTPERGGLPRRSYTVTGAGVAALRESHRELADLVRSMDAVLDAL